jgi:hypothetical protein
MTQPKVLFFLALLCMLIFSSCTKDGINDPIAPEGTAAASEEFSLDGNNLSIPAGKTVFLSNILTNTSQSGSSLSKISAGVKNIQLDELKVDGILVIDDDVKIFTKTLNLNGKINSNKPVYIEGHVLSGGGIINTSAAVQHTIALSKKSGLSKIADYYDSHGGNGQTGAGGTAGANGEFAGFNNNTNGGNGTDAGNGTNGADGNNIGLKFDVIGGPVTILTYGGNGGDGGIGGNGGTGGNSDFYKLDRPNIAADFYTYNCYLANNWNTLVPVPAFNGGNGGRGGNGGNGGKAGSVTVLYHLGLPNLSFNVNSQGGNGGQGGTGGNAGAKGIGLTMTVDINWHLVTGSGWQTHTYGPAPDGLSGNASPNGAGGAAGASGSQQITIY